MRVRRIPLTLQEPTRDGDTVLPMLSQVPLPRAAATHLARLDGQRWRIAPAGWEIPTTRSGESKTLG